MSLSNFTVYDSATGKILRTGSCPSDMVALQPGVGESVVETLTTNIENERVSGGTVVAKTAHGISINKYSFLANSTDQILITGISNPSYLYLEAPTYSHVANISKQAITDGSLTIESNTVGTYYIKIISDTRTTFEAVINAT